MRNIILLVLFVVLFMNQNANAQRHAVRTYTSKQGLSSSHFSSIYQDSKGFIWLGSGENVTRFDGITFDTFEKDTAAPTGITFKLIEDKNNHIWAGMYDALAWFDGSTWKQQREVKNVRSIFFDDKGRLCFFMVNTIFRYTEKTGKVEIFKISTDMLHAAVQLPNGKMLLISDNKQLRLMVVDLEKQKPAKVTTMKELFANTSEILTKNITTLDKSLVITDYDTISLGSVLPRKLHVDSKKNVWVGTEKGVFLLNKENQFIPFFDDKIKGIVRNIGHSKLGKVYFATTEGLFVWNGKELESFGKKRGFSSDNTISALLDENEDIWVGYGDNRVDYLSSKKFANFTTKNKDIEGVIIEEPIKDKYGNLNFFTTEGFYRYDGNRFVKHKALPRFYNFFADSSNHIWLRNETGFTLLELSASIDEPPSITYIDAKNGLPKQLQQLVDYPERPFVFKNGDIWFATYFGIFSYKKGKWNFIQPKHCAASINVTEDKQGNIWIGTWCSLEKIKNDSIAEVFITIQDSKDTTIKITEPAPVSMDMDKNGNLWITAMNAGIIYKAANQEEFRIYTDINGQKPSEIQGTFLIKDQLWAVHKKGIEVFENGKFVSLKDKNNISYSISEIKAIYEDDQNNVWIGTNNGLYRYADQKLYLYNEEDGLVNNDISNLSSFQNKLFVMNKEGISYHLPKYDLPSTLKSNLVFRKITIQNSNQPLASSLTVPSDKNTFEIEFALLDFRKPNLNLYSYKLEGADEDWSEFKTYNFAKYSGLAPGNYTFFVRAKDSQGNIIEGEYAIKINVKAYFYQTKLFYAILALLFVGIVYLLYKGRLKQIKRQNKKLELIIQNRTHDITLKNAELEANQEEMLVQQEKIQEVANELQSTNDALSIANEEVQKINENFTASITYALRIQNAILPTEEELKNHFDIFVLYKPKDIVSGDFYWFAEKENKKILVVADCTGHGVSGGFMTIIGNNILNHIVHDEEIHEPNEILNKMSFLLGKTLSQTQNRIKDGMDIAVISIDTQENYLEYAGAMLPLYYIENQELIEIKADKRPIEPKTKENTFAYKKHKIELPKNNSTTLYLSSDGYADQFGGENDKKFMRKNFKELLQQNSNLPIKEQKKIITSTFNKWKATTKQTDDILVIGIRLDS